MSVRPKVCNSRGGFRSVEKKEGQRLVRTGQEPSREASWLCQRQHNSSSAATCSLVTWRGVHNTDPRAVLFPRCLWVFFPAETPNNPARRYRVSHAPRQETALGGNADSPTGK